MKILFSVPHILLWCVVFSAIELTAAREPIWGDANDSCATMQNFINSGHAYPGDYLTPQKRQSLSDKDKYDIKFPLLFVASCAVAAKFALPLYSSQGYHYLYGIVATIVPAISVAFLAVLLSCLMQMLGTSLKKSLVIALITIFCTPLWNYGRILFSENLQALLLTLVAVVWLRYERTPTSLGAVAFGGAVGMLLNVKIVFLALAPLFLALFVLIKSPYRRVVHHLIFMLLGCLPGILALLGYNFVRYGDFFQFGYALWGKNQMGFNTPLFIGLFGLFLSPGKSLFLYAPVLLLAAFLWPSYWRKAGREAWLFLGIAGIITLIYAKFWSWNGDWAWGPRYLVPVIPLLMVSLSAADFSKKIYRYLLKMLSVLGLGVNLLGNLYNPCHYFQIVWSSLAPLFLNVNPDFVPDDTFSMHYIPEFSPIVAHWIFLKARIFGAENVLHHSRWTTFNIPSWIPSPSQLPTEFDFLIAENSVVWPLFTALVGCFLISAFLLVRVLRLPGHLEPPSRTA